MNEIIRVRVHEFYWHVDRLYVENAQMRLVRMEGVGGAWDRGTEYDTMGSKATSGT